MIPPQEYILLENVEGYTVDHLISAILEGHIDAYIEWPEGKRHVPMTFKGKLSRYARIIQPVFKDGSDKLIFSKVAVLSSEGDIVSEPSLCFTAPIAGIRVRGGDVSHNKPLGAKDVFWSIVKKTLTSLKEAKEKVTHKDLFKELDRLSMDSDEVAAIIENVDFPGERILLASEKKVSFQTVRNKYPLK